MAELKTPRPTYSKWFWKDLIAKIQGMSAAGVGAYVRILAYMVTVSPDFCSIADDDALMSRVAGLGIKSWRRVRPEVTSQLALTDSGRWRSQRLFEDAEVWAYHCTNQRSRRTGGQPERDRMTTQSPPDQTYARSREMPDSERKESDSMLMNMLPNGIRSRLENPWPADETYFEPKRQPATVKP